MATRAIRNISKVLAVTLSLGFCFVSPPSSYAEIDNAGSEFILSVLPNYVAPNVEVHLTSGIATNVTVEYPVNSPTFSTTVPVTPGSVTIVSLPSAAAQGWITDTVQNNSIRLSAADEFIAYTVDRAPFSSDAALGLPLDSLNTEYIVTTYNEAFGDPEVTVTAAFDNTTVTITPSNNLDGGQLAGVPFDIVLNRGEGYMFTGSTGSNGGLAGSIVVADKPVSVTNGNFCTQVPLGTSYCDHIYEQAQPTATWGNKVFAVNLANRPGGTVYRVVSAQDGNEIKLDGVSQGIINRGQFLEIGPIADAHVIEGSLPIFATQFMTGSTSPGATLGDPAMSNLIPSDQFLNGYTLSTVGGGQFAFHFLTIVANDSDVGSLTLDGVAVDSSNFTALPGTGFSYAVLPVDEGTHSTASAQGHGIYLAGYNQDDSYLYPGGARFAFINPTGDANPPICVVTAVLGSPGQFNASGTDNRPSEDTNGNGNLDEGEDLNGNGQIDKDKGIFFVELLPGSSNLQISIPVFVPGSGSVEFSLAAIDPSILPLGTIRVTDGAGNICEALVGGTAVCEDTDLTPVLFALDGVSTSAARLGKSISSSLQKLSGKRSAGVKDVSELENLHLSNWTLTWSRLPKKDQRNCTNASLCVSVESAGALAEYNTSAAQMFAINQRLIRKLKRAGASSELVAKYIKRNKALLSLADSSASQIPESTLSCEESEIS